MRKTDFCDYASLWCRLALSMIVAGFFSAGTVAARSIAPRDIIAPKPSISVTPDIATDQDDLQATFNYGCTGTLALESKTATITGNTIVILAKLSCSGLGRDKGPDDYMDLGRLAGGPYQIHLLVQQKDDQVPANGAAVEVAANDFVVSATPAPGTLKVSEFYNTGLNHYFITGDPAETYQLRASPPLGWKATGYQFTVLPVDTPLSGGLQQVCRFYGSMLPGPNSHFFTADPTECKALAQLEDNTPASLPRWNLEGRVLVVSLPQQGGCPAAYPQAVRRFYNGRALQNDSNHRYVSNEAIADTMRSAGWIDEGVVMCGLP